MYKKVDVKNANEYKYLIKQAINIKNILKFNK